MSGIFYSQDDDFVKAPRRAGAQLNELSVCKQNQAIIGAAPLTAALGRLSAAARRIFASNQLRHN
jgi:hypothetical protein